MEETKDEIEQNSEQYTRVIEFTIFDEGKFSIPALEFKVGDSIYKTIPYEIEVKNSAQSNDEINDIMPNQEVELDFSDYWELYQNHILLILFILAILIVFIFYKKKMSSLPNLEVKNPTEKTLLVLQKLKQKKYIENAEYRSFYVEFLEIIRNFLEGKYQIPAHILLTEDLIDVINENSQISPENKEMLKEIFTRGDLVKFAKTIPNGDLMKKDFNNIENWIKSN